MSGREFEGIINMYYPELRVVFNRSMERFQVIEPFQGAILTLGSSLGSPKKFKVLLTIQEPNGDFRKPDIEDFAEVRRIHDPFHNLRTDIDAQVDRMELEDMRREFAIAPEAQDTISQASKEIARNAFRGRKTTRMGS